MRRGKSNEEIEQENEAKARATQKVASLNASFDKMWQQTELAIKEASEGGKNSKTATKKHDAVVMAATKAGAVLESVEGELKSRLKLAQAKADDVLSEFERVRGELRHANKDVQETKKELNSCLEKKKQVSDNPFDAMGACECF